MPVDCEHQLGGEKRKKKTWSGPGKQEGIFIGIVLNSWRRGSERLIKVHSSVAIRVCIHCAQRLFFLSFFCARLWARTFVRSSISNNSDQLKRVNFCRNSYSRESEKWREREKADLRVIFRLVVRCRALAVAALSALASHGEILGDQRLNQAVHLRPLRREHLIPVGLG